MTTDPLAWFWAPYPKINGYPYWHHKIGHARHSAWWHLSGRRAAMRAAVVRYTSPAYSHGGFREGAL